MIETGNQFGEWTVIGPGISKEYNYKYKHVRRYWKCRCSCGTEKEVEERSLLKETSKSCRGKNHKKVFEDLTGKTFGRLYVKELTEEKEYIYKNGLHIERIYKCICECGKVIYVYGSNLRSGHTNSCGCYDIDKTSEVNKIDMIGKKFGKLTVIRQATKEEQTKSSRILDYICLCECGNTVKRSGALLRSGATCSCGCVVSQYEAVIKKYLDEHNIDNRPQYWFPDLYRVKGHPLRFDFGIIKDNKLEFLLEYNGWQHYNPNIEMGKLQREITDPMKKEYCKKHNIKLIIIKPNEDLIKRLDEIFNMSTPCQAVSDEAEGLTTIETTQKCGRK